jgi:pyruvate/2-oxoglutarate dehydrogenase complex dihydrolipoamide dehydrogenase (E3) component
MPKAPRKVIEADVCLVAIGVSPLLPGGTLKIGLTDRGYIQTNDKVRNLRSPASMARATSSGRPGLLT